MLLGSGLLSRRLVLAFMCSQGLSAAWLGAAGNDAEEKPGRCGRDGGAPLLHEIADELRDLIRRGV